MFGADLRGQETVCAIIAARNAGFTISACLESIENQTAAVKEIVVVDDGSRDNTAELVRSFANDSSSRVILLSNPEPLGSGPSRNRGIASSRSNISMICDADDISSPIRVEESLRLFGEGFDVVGGQTMLVLQGRLLGRSRFPTEPDEIGQRIFNRHDPLPHCTMAFRRRVFDEFGQYPDLRRAQDLAMMLRWADRGATFGISTSVLCAHRLRNDHFNWSTQSYWETLAQFARAWSRDPSLQLHTWLSPTQLADARRSAARRVLRLAARRLMANLPGAQGRFSQSIPWYSG